MNKKILVLLIVILFILSLIFFFTGRISKPEPIADVPEKPLTVSFLQEEIQLIYEKAWLGKISQEEAGERLTILENKAAELIRQHNLQAEIDEFIAQRKTVEELAKWAEPRMMNTELKLTAITDIDAGLARLLWEELSEIENEIYLGKISEEEVDERIVALENKISELVVQHGIETEVDEFMVRMEDIKELTQWAEPQITAIELQLAGIAEYFVEKYRIDTGAEVKQTRALQNKLMDLADDIWEKELVREEINEKLLVLENKADEMIAKHNIQAEVDKYANRSKAGLGRIAAIDQRIKNIQLQLHGLELYLSD